MIEGLVSGKLHWQATQKTARSGNPFTTAKVRVPAGDEAIFCNVIAFSDSAQAALLALGDGDAVALAGTLKPGVWVDQRGQARPTLDMTAAQVLTVSTSSASGPLWPKKATHPAPSQKPGPGSSNRIGRRMTHRDGIRWTGFDADDRGTSSKSGSCSWWVAVLPGWGVRVIFASTILWWPNSTG